MLDSVEVPKEFEPLFARAEEAVAEYFREMRRDPRQGTIDVSGERYLLVRAASMSVEFFDTVAGLYRDEGEDKAREIACQMLFDIAHAVGRQDARAFHSKMNLTDPIEKLSAGPIHFSHTGWAFVKIFAESRPSPDENYYLIYDHPYSFEADSWLAAGKHADFPVCVMNAGYSSGWCEESFGVSLVAYEVSCRAKGDDACRFIMAPPQRIEGHIGRYFEAHPGRYPRPQFGKLEIPAFFERKVMERTLRESEETLRAITAAARDGIIMLDDTGAISFWNPAAEAIFGYSRDEAMGLVLHEVMVPERLRGAYRQAFPHFAATGEGAVVGKTLELPALRKSGEEFPMGLSLSAVKLGGRWSAVGIVRDIGERRRMEAQLRESEERFRQAFEHSAIGMALVGLDGRWLKVNAALCRMLGYSEAELLHKTFQDITHPDDLETDLGYVTRLLAGEIDHYQMEKRYFHCDGHIVWILLSVGLVRDEGGAPVHFVSQIEDITVRRQSEDKLKLFRALIDNSNDSVEVIDFRNLRFLDVNKVTCDELGYSREELLTLGVADIDPGLSSGALEAVKVQLKTSGAARFETMHRRKDGSTFPVEVSARVIELDRPYLLSIVRDISERKRAEEEIRRGEELIRRIVETIPLRVFWKSRDLRYLGCNTLFAHDAGLNRPDELVGKTDFEMGWKDQAELYRADDRRVMETGEIKLSYDEPQTTPAGETIWLRTSKVPLRDDAGEIFAVLGVYEDITEYKHAAQALAESELRVKTILDAAVDGILVADAQTHKLVDGNRAISDMLGYPLDELLGLGVADIHPQDALSEVQCQFERQLAGEIRVAPDLPVKRKDGTVFYADVSTSPMILAGRTYLVGVFHDVTERRRAEEVIRKANEELESKVEERTQQLVAAQESLVRREKLATLGQVAGSVGHELRNPLGVMSNAVYFLQTVLGDADETTKEYLGIIESEIGNAERIVSDLLDSVRTKPPQIDTVAVRPLVERILGKCTVPMGVEVRLDLPETLPPLRVDPLQIGQVLRNLISNGIDAMPEGGVLGIHAAESGDGRTVTVAVQDSGIGMTAEQLARLFQPLFTTKPRGIGLGLVVVKNLTEANGGQVAVQSTAGQGTEFTLTLPAVTENAC